MPVRHFVFFVGRSLQRAMHAAGLFKCFAVHISCSLIPDVPPANSQLIDVFCGLRKLAGRGTA